jgi:clan AA aspartic protease (TIGR02281 family)
MREVVKEVTMFKARFAVPALSLILAIGSFALPAQAAPDSFALGVKQFGAKTYPLAIASFKKAIAANPKNDSARYYYALSLHYSKNIPAAIKAYAELIRLMPDSNGANYARAALAKLDAPLLSSLPPSRMAQQQYSQAPSSATTISRSSGTQQIIQSQSQQGSSSRNSADDKIPDECRVYYTLEGNSFIVDVYVNGRPMKMVFDTGAAMCAFGKNNLAAVGIEPPSGKPSGAAVGIGDGGEQSVWDMSVDLKLGPIERKHFPIKVQNQLGLHPLLGQTFYQDFTYTIDNGAHSIHFVKKRNKSGSIYADVSRDPNAVPFVRERNELAVTVEINGKPTKMYFDTGAEVVTLTKRQCQSLGITIPEDAETTTVHGIAGDSRARVFNVSSIKLGGITKRDFQVWVPDGEMAGVGLLGQTFYNDCQYTIDYERGYIHFMRR